MTLKYDTNFINEKGFIINNNKKIKCEDKCTIHGIDYYVEKIVNTNTQSDLEALKKSTTVELIYCEKFLEEYIKNKEYLSDIFTQSIYNNIVIKKHILKILDKSNNPLELLNNIKPLISRIDDYFVQTLNYDKFNGITKNIVTSKQNYSEYFYNYLLMDFNVDVVPKNIYSLDNSSITSYTRIKSYDKYEEEIKQIKKTIPREKRCIYFR